LNPKEGAFPVQFLLLIHADEHRMLSADEATSAARIAAYKAFTAALQQDGAYVGSNRLQPSRTAATVRSAGGHAKIVDGPFAETKEQLGGYYLIDVADREAALAWAARCPAATHGAVEVRPVWTM
jgi:hypothetical protein